MKKVSTAKCNAPFCTSKSADGISLFHFPLASNERTANVCKKWLQAVGDEDLLQIPAKFLHSNRRLCALHFTDDQFTNGTKNRLKKTAVPTIFDQRISPLSDNTLSSSSNKENELQIRYAGIKVPCRGLTPKVSTLSDVIRRRQLGRVEVIKSPNSQDEGIQPVQYFISKFDDGHSRNVNTQSGSLSTVLEPADEGPSLPLSSNDTVLSEQLSVPSSKDDGHSENVNTQSGNLSTVLDKGPILPSFSNDTVLSEQLSIPTNEDISSLPSGNKGKRQKKNLNLFLYPFDESGPLKKPKLDVQEAPKNVADVCSIESTIPVDISIMPSTPRSINTESSRTNTEDLCTRHHVFGEFVTMQLNLLDTKRAEQLIQNICALINFSAQQSLVNCNDTG